MMYPMMAGSVQMNGKYADFLHDMVPYPYTSVISAVVLDVGMVLLASLGHGVILVIQWSRNLVVVERVI